MEPVVNGLDEKYSEEIEFRSLNAVEEGVDAFKAYALPGHPSYIVLNPAGEVLWRGFGELPGEAIEAELIALIE
jgi:hypothetical protein